MIFIHRNLDSENFQVMNYGIGGMISLHVDDQNLGHSHEHATDPERTRIMTHMIYLSDVVSGGHTIFPQVGVSVKPIKGSALFWFNIGPDMFHDSRMAHLGCPVLYGNKWIVNKWIKLSGQYAHHKCTMSEKTYTIHTSQVTM